MTLPVEQISQICKSAAEYNEMPEGNNGATLCGIHLEGPFLSEAKKGAQNGAYLMRANIDTFHKWQDDAKGLVKLISIAPEYPENMEFIRQAKDEVSISLAHSTADYETAIDAFKAGADHVTHLFNAMNPLSHRSPGIPGAAHDAKAYVELICDGVHIHPGMIRTAFSIYGEDRVILISDSMEATGMPDGTYSLGGQSVTVKGNLATLQDGTIAGSATNLMDCVRFAVKEVGLPLETAIKCATVNPAKSIGVFDKYGSLDVGKAADFVLLDKDLNLKGVYVNGKKIV
jgi:N-acetylglucosamine-6-phosphate deacetylase